MPPRGRGGRKPRGGAARPSAASIPTDEAAEAPNQSANAESSSSAPIAPAFPTPQHDDSMDVDPNTSPASPPTETPAPTPMRPPPTPTESVQPALASASNSAAPPGVKIKKESRFKPKAVRTSEAKRKELEDAERAKQKQLEAERQKSQRFSGRGNAMRARGRGDAMGRGREVGSKASVGAFGGMWASEGSLKHPSRSSGGGGGGGSSSGYAPASRGSAFPNASRSGGPSNSRSGATRTFTHNGIEIPVPRYPDEDNDTPMVDVEDINHDSDDDDQGGYSSSKGKGKAVAQIGSMKPIRLARIEHQDRKPKASSDQVKAEPAPEEDDPTDIVKIDEVRSSGTNGDENRVRVKIEPAESMDDIPEADINPIEPSPKKAKAHTQLFTKVHKPVIQSEEDKAEWERHADDVLTLLDEFKDKIGTGSKKEPEGEEAAEEAQAYSLGRAYVFQFPPTLPVLYNPATTPKPPPPRFKQTVKKEDDEDVQILRSVHKKPDPKKEQKTTIKIEEDAVEKPAPIRIIPEEGKIGKLIIKESGKVFMKWGGTRLVLNKGSDFTFLTSAAIIEHPETIHNARVKTLFSRTRAEEEKMESAKGKTKVKEEHDLYAAGRESQMGESMSMGKIMGKFIMTPDWEKM